MADEQHAAGAESPISGEHRRCPHGFHHPPWPHPCDGCWCEGERDRRDYGWDHDTGPAYRIPPEGWSDFGAHVDRPDVPLELSSETGEDGLPLWERPVEQHPDHEDQEASR